MYWLSNGFSVIQSLLGNADASGRELAEFIAHWYVKEIRIVGWKFWPVKIWNRIGSGVEMGSPDGQRGGESFVSIYLVGKHGIRNGSEFLCCWLKSERAQVSLVLNPFAKLLSYCLETHVFLQRQRFSDRFEQPLKTSKRPFISCYPLTIPLCALRFLLSTEFSWHPGG